MTSGSANRYHTTVNISNALAQRLLLQTVGVLLLLVVQSVDGEASTRQAMSETGENDRALQALAVNSLIQVNCCTTYSLANQNKETDNFYLLEADPKPTTYCMLNATHYYVGLRGNTCSNAGGSIQEIDVCRWTLDCDYDDLAELCNVNDFEEALVKMPRNCAVVNMKADVSEGRYHYFDGYCDPNIGFQEKSSPPSLPSPVPSSTMAASEALTTMPSITPTTMPTTRTTLLESAAAQSSLQLINFFIFGMFTVLYGQ